MMGADGLPFRRSKTGVILSARITPKSAMDRVDGLIETPDGPALKVRVRAAPEKGRANDALVDAVAGWLRIPKSALALAGGGKSRNKMLAVTGDPERLAALIADRIGTLKREAITS